MKYLFKKVLAVILVLAVSFSMIPCGLNNFGIKAKASYLTDAQITRFINLFYDSGTVQAEEMAQVLRNEKSPTSNDVIDFYKKISLFLDVTAEVDLDNKIVSNLVDVSIFSNVVSGVLDIIDKSPTIFSDASALEKSVAGLQACIGFFKCMQLGDYIPSELSLVLSVIDVSLVIAGYFEKKYYQKHAVFYEMDLIMQYGNNEKVTYRKAPPVLGLGITQEEADAIYAELFLKYFMAQCVKRTKQQEISNGDSNSGSGSTDTGDNTEIDIENISFVIPAYTMFANYKVKIPIEYSPANATNTRVNICSMDTKIATIGDDFSIVPVAPGTVTIRITAESGVYSDCEINILPFNAQLVDDRYHIINYIGNKSAVTIPESVWGIPVTKVLDNAFKNDSITSISIPNSVTTIGENAFYGCAKLSEVTIPSNVKKINKGVFAGCIELENINIPKGVTDIGPSAFYGCENLTNIVIPNSVTTIGADAFYGCSKLSEIAIPESVENIGNRAFSKCKSVKILKYYSKKTLDNSFGLFDDSSISMIYIGKFVKIKNEYLFDDLDDLQEIIVDKDNQNYFSDGCGVLFDKSQSTLISYPSGNKRQNYVMPSSVKNIKCNAFENSKYIESITLSDNLTEIGERAFYNCSNIKEITIPNKVSNIGYYSFANCPRLAVFNFNATNCLYMGSFESGTIFGGSTSLSTVNIGNNVESIPDFAFVSSGINSLNLGNSVTTIGNYSFADTSFIELSIPKSVKSIGDYAFNYTAIKDLIIPDEVVNIGNFAFSSSKVETVKIGNQIKTLGEGVFYDCNELNSVIIGESMSSIGTYTFNGCNKLSNIVMSPSVKDLGDYSFENCDSLINLQIPSSIERIGECAFFGCDGLKKVEIGKNVNSIEFSAFAHCENLESIVFDTDTNTNIGCAAFMNCYELKNVKFGKKIKNIGDSAFRGCNKMGYLEMPRYIENIEAYAFEESSTNLLCYANSLAHHYAEDNSITYILVDVLTGNDSNIDIDIDFENRIISGLVGDINLLKSSISVPIFHTLLIESDNKRIATGTKISIISDDDEIVSTYTALVFGDVNGDGWYNGEDAFLVNLIANGILNEDDVGSVIWTAADCNHDGVVDEADVELLTSAGLLLDDVDQSATQTELEANTAYIEYMGLIDQSFGINADNSITETELTEGNALERFETETNNFDNSITVELDIEAVIVYIFNFIKAILAFVFSIVV